jgi:hypothetical protein
MDKKKIFLVKREVIASNIKEAMRKKGRIYSIEETEEEVKKDKSVGFDKK